MRFWSQAWTTNEMKNNIKNVSWAQNDTKLSCAKAKKRLLEEIEEKPLEAVPAAEERVLSRRVLRARRCFSYSQ